MLIDTHCHIHDPEFKLTGDDVRQRAHEAGVSQLICIGTSAEDSVRAVDFVQDKPDCYAAIGLHPHDAALGEDDFEVLARLVTSPKVVAIGEFGLDYYYQNSPQEAQKTALRYQLELAASCQKPCVFHIREAFDDFWAIFDAFEGISGVVHSFSATIKELNEALNRGLYIGLNGIMTFTKNADQLAAAKAVPLDRLVLETDAPFLTPTPKRGTINEPANVKLVAEFLAELKAVSYNEIAAATTKNAGQLFGI